MFYQNNKMQTRTTLSSISLILIKLKLARCRFSISLSIFSLQLCFKNVFFLVSGSTDVIKHQNQTGEKRVYFNVDFPITIHHGPLKTGAWKQKSWRSAVFWLAPHCLLGLICYTLWDHLPIVGWALCIDH